MRLYFFHSLMSARLDGPSSPVSKHKGKEEQTEAGNSEEPRLDSWDGGEEDVAAARRRVECAPQEKGLRAWCAWMRSQ